jgi:hypothetical protein
MKITKEIENKILELNEDKRSNRFIANELGIARSSIKNVLEKHGKKTHNLHIRLERKGNQLRCLVCKDFKDYETFVYAKSKNAGGTCKDCRTTKRRNKRKQSVENFFQYKWRTTKDRALKLKCPFNLSVDDLIRQYQEQQGRCFYTDENFADFDSTRDRNTLSVDKVDPTKGYVNGNIVLCTFRSNVAKSDFTLEEMKKWMPEWAKRIEHWTKTWVPNKLKNEKEIRT